MSWNWQQSQCSRKEQNRAAVNKRVAFNAQLPQKPLIIDPFPESEDHLALVLVTRGLEDLAMSYLVQQQIVPSMAHLTLLPRPDNPALGAASVDKLIVRLGSDDCGEMKLRENLRRLQEAPVVQAVLAFVVAASGLETRGGWEERDDAGLEAAQKDGAAAVNPEDRWAMLRCNYKVIPTGVLDQLAHLVGSTTRWPMAEKLLKAAGAEKVRRFRASCVTGGSKDTGFGCTDAMRAIGGGALSAHSFGNDPRWKVDLQRYDVELYGFVFHDTFACGLLLGGQWRRNSNEDKYSFSSVPYGERASRLYTVGDHQPWFMPRLRQSTAFLLLILADLQPGEKLLDPMGGCGTTAIEAAVHFEGVCAITSDKNPVVTSAAIKNCILARPHFAEGSSVKAEDWDACNLAKIEDGSIDKVITDMPFGNKCRWDIAASLPAMLGEVARVLRQGGRAVLLMKGYRRLEALLTGLAVQDEDYTEEDCEDTLEGSDGVDPSCGSASVASPPAGTNVSAIDTPEPVSEAEEMSIDAKESVSAPNQTGTIDCLALLERRPIAIGGYLCYALVLEKRL